MGTWTKPGERDFDKYDPETFCTVEVAEKVLRGLNKRWSLYSVGPSCGSASNLDIPQLARGSATGISMPASDSGACTLPRVVPSLGVVEGVKGHGEATLTGSVSYVKMDAIPTRAIKAKHKFSRAFHS